jgi:hypothetical protein
MTTSLTLILWNIIIYKTNGLEKTHHFRGKKHLQTNSSFKRRPTSVSSFPNPRLGYFQQVGNTIYGEDRTYPYDDDDYYNSETGDYFGASVALNKNGTRFVAGAPGYPNSCAGFSSYASVYELQVVNNNEEWVQLGSPLELWYGGNSIAMDEYGNRIVASYPGDKYTESSILIFDIEEESSSSDMTKLTPQWRRVFAATVCQPFSYYPCYYDITGNGSRVSISPNGSYVTFGNIMFHLNDNTNEWDLMDITLEGSTSKFNGDSTRLLSDTYIYDLDDTTDPSNPQWIKQVSRIDPNIKKVASADINSHGDRVAIETGGNSLHVYDYDSSSEQWVLTHKLLKFVQTGKYIGGVSMSADGNRILVLDDSKAVVKVFEYDKDRLKWNKFGSEIKQEVSGDGYRASLSKDGDHVVMGAPYNNGNGNDTGSVRVFKLDYDDIDALQPIQIQSSLDVDDSGTTWCLQPKKPYLNRTVNVRKCDNAKKKQQWLYDDTQQLRLANKPWLCLSVSDGVSSGSKLDLDLCVNDGRNLSKTRFFYDESHNLLYMANKEGDQFSLGMNADKKQNKIELYSTNEVNLMSETWSILIL